MIESSSRGGTAFEPQGGNFVYVMDKNEDRHVYTDSLFAKFKTMPDVVIHQWDHVPYGNSRRLSPHELNIVNEYFWATGLHLEAPPKFWLVHNMPVSQ